MDADRSDAGPSSRFAQRSSSHGGWLATPARRWPPPQPSSAREEGLFICPGGEVVAMAHFSALLGRPVCDAAGQPVGKLVDLIVPADIDYPPIQALVAEPRRGVRV